MAKGKNRKVSRKDRMALADPVTPEARMRVLKVAQERYDAPKKAITAEMNHFLAGRNPRSLTGPDAVRLASFRERFNALAKEEERFIEALLSRQQQAKSG